MKKGFTLAEVLITLSIIGVVAALTIPELVKNMNDYAFTKSKDVTLAKITEATNQMKSNDVLADYATTEDFANEFAKYIKIARRCTSANLTQCFAPKFRLANGDEVDTSTLTLGTSMGALNSTSPTVGLGLANGTTMVISLLKSTGTAGDPCARIDPLDNKIDTTACLSMLYDINGLSGPNVEGKDIQSKNVTIVSCVTVAGLCVGTSDITFTPIGEAPYAGNDNYWAGARNKCIALGLKLPTVAQLNTIYQNKATIGNFAGSNAYYWAFETWNGYGQRKFVQNFTTGDNTNFSTMNDSSVKARCIK